MTIPGFRSVPFTGVIFVMAEAGRRGYRYGHPDWCNLGQGQPETGPLPGSPPRVTRVEIGPGDQDYAPIPGLWELRRAVADLYNELYRKGNSSQYSELNVCICGGGRASLTRAVAALDEVNLGHFLPDYTAYEELLERSAGDTKTTAGQYFTPRPLIDAIVDVVQPTVADRVVDPACGTGGFLLAAHARATRDAGDLTPPEREHLQTKFARGIDIGSTTSRLASMNLLLHGLGSITGDSLIDQKDALIADPGERWSVVLANPPFGRSSSTDISAGGDDSGEIFRQDFVVTTSNKQLNFQQHIMTILDINGRAGVVLPDNVLFEGGAGETLRRKLLDAFDFHTLLRLPTGIFYKPGVKANVLFFDKKPAAEQPWTQRLWVYDLRTNKHFTLKKRPMRRSDLDDFVSSYLPGRDRGERVDSERWKPFTYDELIARDKVNLDLTWLRDESLEDADNLPAPDIIAREIVEDLTAALAEFEAVAAALEAATSPAD